MPLLLPISCAWLVSFWVGLSRLVLFARKGYEGRGKVGRRVGVARAVHVVCVWIGWFGGYFVFCFVGGGIVLLFFFFFRRRMCRVAALSRELSSSLPLLSKTSGIFVSLIIRDATTTSENASLVFSRFRLPKHTVANSISFVLFQLRPSLRVTRSFRPGCPLALDLLFALG